MSNQKKKRITCNIATVTKEDIPERERPSAKMTLRVPKRGHVVSKTVPLGQGALTTQVQRTSYYQSPSQHVQCNSNKLFQDRGTQASGTWHQMLCKVDGANASPGWSRNNNADPPKKSLLNKDIGKVMTVLKQLFKILLNSFEDKKIWEEPLKTLKETEMVIYAMAQECNYDALANTNEKYTTFAEDFCDTLLSELSRKKVSDLQRKINILEDEKEIAQKNVKILKRQLENGKQVILKSLEEKAKNEALRAEIKSAFNNVPNKHDLNSLKSAKLKLEEELAVKTALVSEIKTEIKSLKKENWALKLKEERLTASLAAYKDGFHSLKQALVDKVQDLRFKTCQSSPTCSTFIDSPNVSPFPRGSTSTIRNPNFTHSSDALSSTEEDPGPVSVSSFPSRSSHIRVLNDKKQSTRIQEIPSKRPLTFSRVKDECQEFFGDVIPQAVALAEGAHNLNVLGENIVTNVTHVTEISSAAETISSQSDLV